MKKALYTIYDLLTVILGYLFLPFLLITRKYGVENFPLQLKLFRVLGVFPIRDHYYEPRFIYGQDFKANQVRSLPFEIDLQAQISELQKLSLKEELPQLPAHKGLVPASFYVHNPNFGAGDAELYYLLIRNRKPKRMVEIGSGYSTQLCLLALEKNKAEGFECALTCIEPYEMPFLDTLTGISVVRKKVEQVSLDVFQSLEAGDMLFIDSSHIIRPDNDLLFIYFQILPILQKGVLVHIHDIFTPRHYPQEWLTQKMRFWNEQYLLEAFLYNNEGFKILFAANHLVKTNFEAAKELLIHLKTDSAPSSFWVERV